MKYLVDTHLLIWAASNDNRLSIKARRILNDETNTLFFSSASIWELSIKSALRPDAFSIDVAAFYLALTVNGYEELPVTGRHGLATRDLPAVHRDPFDRILVAQALVEGCSLLTADGVLAGYPGVVVIL